MSVDAKKLEALLPYQQIPLKVRQAISSTHGPICVACSGGPDSMALLYMVQHYWPERLCIVLHYNHRVRKVSDAEEIALRDWVTKKMGLRIECGHREDKIGTSECALRQARYAFFEKILRLYNASILFLGHHQDDLFETVLMRLVRGVSLEGLIAPKAVQPTQTYTKLRPLLNFSKETLINICKICELPYFIDATNQTDMCLRNRIRHKLLTQFDDVFLGTNWRKGFAKTCSILAEHRDFLIQNETDVLWHFDFSKMSCARDVFCKLSLFEQRNFLRNWFQTHAIATLCFDQIERVMGMLQLNQQGTINLDARHSLYIKNETLSLVLKEKLPLFSYEIFWLNGQLLFPNGYTLKMEVRDFSESLYGAIVSKKMSHNCVAVLDAASLTYPFRVRGIKPGDHYCPIGKNTDKKVKFLCNDKKIYADKKVWLPVITSKTGDIAWTPGLPPAEKFKVLPTTKKCIFLFYQKI